MPITIQEIIASDTISQLVDKTNFNFDQLLLNGGGPAGPIGPKGPTGPAGGRGPKGSTWYEDTSIVAPGVTPVAVPPTPTPLPGDFYLQFNGDVWEYVGTVWLQTTINLEGPTGPTGPAGGFGEIFGAAPNVTTEKNTVYNGQIGTTTTGANATNEGVPSILMGGVSSIFSNPDANMQALLTNSYVLPLALELALTSDVASVMVHQAYSTGKSIIFHGGGAAADYYEQSILANLSNIAIGVDDRLILEVPKVGAAPLAFMNDLIGFEVSAPNRSSSHRVGQQIRFVTGADPVQYGVASENSNFEIEVGVGSATANKLLISTLSANKQTIMQMGGGVTASVGQTTNPGDLQFLNGETNFDVTNTGAATGEFTANAQGGISLITDIIGATTTAPIRFTTKDGTISSVSTGGNIISTTNTGQIDSIIAAGVGDITLQTQGTVANTPGNKIVLDAGNVGYGRVEISSRHRDIVLDSRETGDIQILTDSKRRVYFDGGKASSHGVISLGGTQGINTGATVPFDIPLIVVNSDETFNSDIATPSIQFAIPRGRSGNTSPVSGNFLRFNGGGEIVGPFLPFTTIPSGGLGYPFQKENEGALHLRGGVAPIPDGPAANGTVNPGSVWMYPQEPTNTNAYNSTLGQWKYGNVRLWSTPDPRLPSIGQTSSGIGSGISLGLDANLISTQTSGFAANYSDTYKPVTGRVSMYGKSTFGLPAVYGGTTDLNQNNLDYQDPGGSSQIAASVNVGDKYRATQSFKVFGDYVGTQFYGGAGVAAGTQVVGGGIISGLPKAGTGIDLNAIQMQNIMSGSTLPYNNFQQSANSWSPWIPNQGVDGSLEVLFKYRYQWNRVGRVVTGSGTIKQQITNNAAGSQEVPSTGCVHYMDAGTPGKFKNFVSIGPIPFPVQCGEGMSTHDSTITYDQGWGVGNWSMSGTAQGVIDYVNQSSTPKVSLYSNDAAGTVTPAFSMQTILANDPTITPASHRPQTIASPSVGIVGISNGLGSTAPLSAQTGSTGSQYMWIKMYCDNSASPFEAPVGTDGGVIPSFIKFTFAYEIGAYDNKP